MDTSELENILTSYPTASSRDKYFYESHAARQGKILKAQAERAVFARVGLGVDTKTHKARRT